jgi:hypothetical protein
LEIAINRAGMIKVLLFCIVGLLTKSVSMYGDTLDNELSAVEKLRREEDWTNALSGYSRLEQLAGQHPSPAVFRNLIIRGQALCESDVDIVARASDRILASTATNRNALAAHLTVYQAFILALPSAAGHRDFIAAQERLGKADELRLGRKPYGEEEWLLTLTRLAIAQASDVLEVQLKLASQLISQIQSDQEASGGERARWIIYAAQVLAESADLSALSTAIESGEQCLQSHSSYPDRLKLIRMFEGLRFKLDFRSGRFESALLHLKDSMETNSLLFRVQEMLCLRGLDALRSEQMRRAAEILCKEVIESKVDEIDFQGVGSTAIVAYHIGNPSLARKLIRIAIDRYRDTDLAKIFLSSPERRFRSFYRSDLQNLVCSYGEADDIVRYCHILRGVVDRSIQVELAYVENSGPESKAVRNANLARLNALGVMDEFTPDVLIKLNQSLLGELQESKSFQNGNLSFELAPDQLLINLVLYNPSDINGMGTKQAYALLVTKGQEPTRVERTEELVVLLQNYRFAIDGRGSWDDVTHLSKYILDKVGGLDGIRKIAIVADGSASVVGWGSLPDLRRTDLWASGREVICLGSLAAFRGDKNRLDSNNQNVSGRHLIQYLPSDLSEYPIRWRGSDIVVRTRFDRLPRLSASLESFAKRGDQPCVRSTTLQPLFSPKGSEIAIILAHGVPLRSEGLDYPDIMPVGLVFPNPLDPEMTVVTPMDLLRMGRCTTRQVVLASCWGARDEYFPGSDAIALPWSLISCGAESVISPAWPITDRSSAEYLAAILPEIANKGHSWSHAHMAFIARKTAVDHSSKLIMHQMYGGWQERRRIP